MKYFHLYLSLLMIIIFVSSLYSHSLYSHSLSLKESFTPRIREMYRPYVRHSRIFTNNMYNNHKNNINNFLRKIGFI
jgi:hypothetical protein